MSKLKTVYVEAKNMKKDIFKPIIWNWDWYIVNQFDTLDDLLDTIVAIHNEIEDTF
jgi:hypothetical protein